MEIEPAIQNTDAEPSNAEEVETNKDEPKANDMEKTASSFKRPVLIGKIGRLPRKISPINTAEEKGSSSETEDVSNEEEIKDSEALPQLEVHSKPIKAPAQQLTENSIPLPYKEPPWSGLPSTNSKDYIFEVLKSGVIVDHINLMQKPFWVFGRQPNCDIYMAHPTISRYHAVLQYRTEGTEENPAGFYIYDLRSTHGTFLNKGQLKPRVFAPVKVGHMIKLGFSTRSFVLAGPEEDAEEESEFTLTELKKQRAEKLLRKDLEEKALSLKQAQEKEQQRKRDEERGVDWGLGEDADEESDLAENPYAQSNNEELYIDDPKKALRGFMEREGYDLEYDCTEQGFGQFLCKVELPIDDDRGRPIVAEVLHKGKKKEAVMQCALEACRILDRYGVLRQATHESRKRKAKNWEENDYYDSDEDTFLDRTGAIEKKREKRMQSKAPQQPETYQSLLEKENKISQKIANIEEQLAKVRSGNSNKSSTCEEDSLDSFMKELKQESKLDKQTISKLKSELIVLRTEQANLVKLVNLAKPADLPPLVINNKNATEQESGIVKPKTLPIFGKRPKIKVQLPAKLSLKKTEETMNTNQEENDEEEEELEGNQSEIKQNSTVMETEPDVNNVDKEKQTHNSPYDKNIYSKIAAFEKLLLGNEIPLPLEKYVPQMQGILQNIKDLTKYECQIQTEKTIMSKNLKTKKCLDKPTESYNEQDFIAVLKDFRRIFIEMRDVIQKTYKTVELSLKIQSSCTEMLQKISKLEESNKKNNKSEVIKSNNEEVLHSEDEDENDKNSKHFTLEDLEKRKKKNKRRLQHRQERAEIEKQKGYQEDAQKEDYNMWVPPQNQTGDGRTTLNERYGY